MQADKFMKDWLNIVGRGWHRASAKSDEIDENSSKITFYQTGFSTGCNHLDGCR